MCWDSPVPTRLILKYDFQSEYDLFQLHTLSFIAAPARQIFRIENLHLSGNPVIFTVLRTEINKICKDPRFEASYIVCQMKTVNKTFAVLPEFCLCHYICRMLIRSNKSYQAISVVPFELCILAFVCCYSHVDRLKYVFLSFHIQTVQHLDTIKFFYSPTDVQVNWL
jgi:hypothetical protein